MIFQRDNVFLLLWSLKFYEYLIRITFFPLLSPCRFSLSFAFTLKVKQPVIWPAKWICLGIADELQFGTHKLWWTIGKSKDQRRGMWLYEEEEEGGRLLWTRVHCRKLRVQGGDGFSSAELGCFLTEWACCWARSHFSFFLVRR